MAATQTAVSDGTLNVINVSIPYFDEDDISVVLDLNTALVLNTDYIWSSTTTIQFLDTLTTPGGLVPAGVTVLLRRETKDDEMYNIFDGNAAFSRAALDENFQQLLYRAQEFSAGLGIDGLNNDLSMNGWRITDLGEAQEAGDALNLGQAQDLVATEAAARTTADAAEASARQAADAALQAQLLGTTPPAGSQFSQISWHGQTIDSSIMIPDDVNAWSFGPYITIEAGQMVTIGDGSFWTIADGAQTQEGPLVMDFPDNLDAGILV